jgi:hypothetical protein
MHNVAEVVYEVSQNGPTVANRQWIYVCVVFGMIARLLLVSASRPPDELTRHE